MDKKPDGPVLSPLQLKPNPNMPGPIVLTIAIEVNWRFMLDMLRKWIRGKPFVQKIELKHHIMPK